MNNSTYTLHVSGTHCVACKHLIEETLEDEKYIKKVLVSLEEETLTLTTEDSVDPQKLASHLTELLSPHGVRAAH